MLRRRIKYNVKYNFEELVSTSDGERNWPGVLIALFVIIVVLSLILVSTILLSPGDRLARVVKPKVARDTIGKEPLNKPVWTRRGDVVFRDSLGGITFYNPETNVFHQILDNSTFRQLNALDFYISADYQYVIFVSNMKLDRYAKEANYHVYEISTKMRSSVSPIVDEFHTQQYTLQRVAFSPVGSAFAFVYENDLYYSPNGTNRNVLRLTETGSSWVYNGYPDWIYQNEIYKNDEAFWFSISGTYIAYASFNDSLVGKVVFTEVSDFEDPYPKLASVAYPKPGTKNPDVNLWVIHIPDSNATLIEKPKHFEDSYLTKVTWINDEILATVWLNRRQNVSIFSICNSPDFKCDVKHVVQKAKGFVDLTPTTDHLVREYLDLLALYPSQYRTLAPARLSNQLYFEAKPVGKPTQRHLYKIKDDLNITLVETCLTCPTHYGNTTDTANETDNESHPVRSTDCLYTSSIFSDDAQYFIVNCQGPDVPSFHVVETESNRKIATITSNKELKKFYYSFAVPQIKMFQVELDDGRHAQVKLQLPPGLREYEDMAFPLLLKISHRPGEPKVSYKWSLDYETYLASAKNYILAEVDTGEMTVGSDGAMHQISVVRYLRDNLKFVDSSRVGVYGSGYGGYLTAMILTQDDSIFKCGISISGIFSWPHYNAVSTERWLRTANVSDNYRGYEEADVLKRIGNLKGRRFLVVDSTADPDVHFQHSMLLVRSLVREGVIFSHMTYPGAAPEPEHFARLQDDFWDDCFGLTDYTEWEQGTSSLFALKN